MPIQEEMAQGNNNENTLDEMDTSQNNLQNTSEKSIDEKDEI